MYREFCSMRILALSTLLVCVIGAATAFLWHLARPLMHLRCHGPGSGEQFACKRVIVQTGEEA